MRHFCQLYTWVALSKNFSFSPDALWRCCSYWFHLCKLSLYSNSELKAPPFPHLIRLLERYNLSVTFYNQGWENAVWNSNHQAYFPVMLAKIALGFSATLRLTDIWTFFWIMDSFYVLISYDFITTCLGFVSVSIFLCACIRECLIVFMRSVYVYWLHECTGCAHTRLHINLLQMQRRFIQQWLRDLTAIYWAARGLAHCDFYGASWQKCANQGLMHN